jgi:hypothetical protein
MTMITHTLTDMAMATIIHIRTIMRIAGSRMFSIMAWVRRMLMHPA